LYKIRQFLQHPHFFLQISKRKDFPAYFSKAKILQNQTLCDSSSVVFLLHSTMANMSRLSGEFIYNTAGWQDDTAELDYQAIELGCRNFETGNHPNHCRQELVGEGIRKAISENETDRSEIFVSLLCPFSSSQPSLIQLVSDPNQVLPDGFPQDFKYSQTSR
jgi:hypothetical protein